jgi:23S rRNA (pseudouridine1915-N3)-methyltransferase
MKYRIITVGKANESELSGAIRTYETRLARQVGIQWLFVPSVDLPLSKQQRVAESRCIDSRLSDKDYVILLDETGKQYSSEAFSEQLVRLRQRSLKEITFIIGGAYGVDEALQERADLIISFGKMVFPHQIMRLLLAEQLYRAATIESGSGYHHA